MNTQIQNIKINAAFKKYFPRIFAKIKEKKMMNDDSIQDMCYNQIILEKYFKEHIQGLNVDVYSVPYDEVNAYTYPSIGLNKKYKSITIYDIYNEIDKIYSNMNISKILNQIKKNGNGLHIVKKNNKIILNNNLSYNPLIFITKPMLGLLNKDELISIMLHEIGHHFYMDPNTIGYSFIILRIILLSSYYIILAIFSTNKKNASYVVLLMILFFGIQGAINLIQSNASYNTEYAADSMAVFCGYGEQLASSFRKMTTKKNADPSKIRRALLIIEDILQRLLITKTHPDMYKRIEEIKEKTKKLDKINWNEVNPQLVEIDESYMDLLKIIDITISKLI